MESAVSDYFQNYEKFYGKEVMDFVKTNLSETWIDSAGGKIHLDKFIAKPSGPVIIFSHGMAGYGRMLAPYAFRFFHQGFNVILPDLKGYGHNKGRRGHWKWHDLIQNLVDIVNYAEKEYNERVFLAGASMGGVIAYHAVCHGAPVKALACYCLFDFQDTQLINETSSYGPFTPLVKGSLKLLSRIAPHISLPASSVSSYDNLSDSTNFNDLVKNDPLAGNKMTLTAAAEMLGVKLPVPFENYNLVPVIVIQPGADKMTPAHFSRKAFKALGTSRKKYLEIEGRGHWIIDNNGIDLVCTEIMGWFQAVS